MKTNKVTSFVAANGSKMLTGGAVVGIIATAIIGVQTGKKVHKKLVKLEEKIGRKLTFKEKLKETWMDYIPLAASAAVTIGSCVTSKALDDKKVAISGAAATAAQSALATYENAAKETLGEKSVEKIEEHLSKKECEAHPYCESDVIDTGFGHTLMFDYYSGRYFRSDVDKVKSIFWNLSDQLRKGDVIYMSDYQDAMGLPRVEFIEDYKWEYCPEHDITKIEPRMDAIMTYMSKEPSCVCIRAYQRPVLY